MAGEDFTKSPDSNSQRTVPGLAIDVWLMPLGVVWQPTATTRASKAMKVVFTPPDHNRPTAGVNGGGGGLRCGGLNGFFLPAPHQPEFPPDIGRQAVYPKNG